MKKLYRSSSDRMIAGVCGGVSEYTNIDPIVIRLLALFLFLATGLFSLGIVYILAMFMVPQKLGAEPIVSEPTVTEGKTE